MTALAFRQPDGSLNATALRDTRLGLKVGTPPGLLISQPNHIPTLLGASPNAILGVIRIPRRSIDPTPDRHF